MDAAGWEELERIMSRLAGGDAAMVLTLATRFREEVAAAVSFHARDLGVAVERAELDGLVFDACDALAAVAGAWRPGRALPWVWGRARVRAVVLRHAVGRTAALPDGYDLPDLDLRLPHDDPGELEVLTALARVRPDAAVVLAALERAVPPADRAVLLLHARQVAGGDPAPAVTVARACGRSPAAVRKSVERNRRRLADLATGEERFRLLLDLPLLGPAARRAA